MLERSLMGFSLSHFFAVLLGNAYPEISTLIGSYQSGMGVKSPMGHSADNIDLYNWTWI